MFGPLREGMDQYRAPAGAFGQFEMCALTRLGFQLPFEPNFTPQLPKLTEIWHLPCDYFSHGLNQHYLSITMLLSLALSGPPFDVMPWYDRE